MITSALLRTALGSLSVGDDVAYISSARAFRDVLTLSRNGTDPVIKDTYVSNTRTCAAARVSVPRSSLMSFAGAGRVVAASHRRLAKVEVRWGHFRCVLNGDIGGGEWCGQADVWRCMGHEGWFALKVRER